ncbi:uncharacterized protein K444DRAFT_182931 [Hyaloscypha bicolor E]|uniref:Uncharacterized protein n=1 Tax=Hyaloscypha bicolor E TaxID=1095630 RepID=A0A2J6TRA9_9HELO|nr:uncharacterized protein K444DRAFT_182931 [Hyaloscypha bicolor E]PMD65560.1 hypothetical protein K444DRAFT_182931 [Hyaloscypha bicolor E]
MLRPSRVLLHLYFLLAQQRITYFLPLPPFPPISFSSLPLLLSISPAFLALSLFHKPLLSWRHSPVA